MILSASRRTDIPCYHGPWIMNRLRAGYALTRNPMNHGQIHRIPLSPQLIDCIVFWTKNAGPFMPYLDELNQLGYRYYFQYTLTPYEADLETGLPPKEQLLQQFAALGRRIGPDRLVWRYDPILLTKRYTAAFHETAFAAYCHRLFPYTDEVVISFFDLYARLKGRGLSEPAPEEMKTLAASLSQIARSYHLTIRSCSEAVDFTAFGVTPGCCIDQTRIERICQGPLIIRRDPGQRLHCGCVQSVDIGAYNTCLNGCQYCYANYCDSSIRQNLKKCDPASPLLLGQLGPDEVVLDRAIASNLSDQLHL